MKRIFVLIALFSLMFALGQLPGAELGAQSTPLVLASIGFTALFAFTVGELVSLIGLPRVTGFILTGVILGPQVAGIFSTQVVNEMKMFNTLALGLIALSAGLELDAKATWRLRSTLAWTVLFKILFLVLLVGGTFVGIELVTHRFGFEGMNKTLAFALVIAVLGIGTSPAIVLAILNDTKAKGRWSELILSIAVVKDLVVVVCLAVAMAVAKALLSGGAFDPSALSHVAVEIGASILVGAIAGALIVAYIRYIHAEMLFFVVAVILGIAQLSDTLHLELLLVFIVAGFIVRNLSPYEHELLHPLEVVALPVFVVFFTTAGAAIDLTKTLSVLPIALALFGARIVALVGASYLGGKLGKEQPIVQKVAWLGYIPQAGVTLGLVLLASKQLPQLSEQISTMGIALVALNLLTGPITLGVSLRKSGEVPGGEVDPAENEAHGHGHDQAHATEDTTEDEAPEEHAPIADHDGGLIVQIPALELKTLNHIEDEHISRTLWRLFEGQDRRVMDQLDVLESDHDALTQALQQALQEGRAQDTPTPALVRTLGEVVARHETLAALDDLEQCPAQLQSTMSSLPQQAFFSLDPELLILSPDETSRQARLGAWWRRLRIKLAPKGQAAHRSVPVKMATRIAVEVRHFEALTEVIDGQQRAFGVVMARLGECLERSQPLEQWLEESTIHLAQALRVSRARWRTSWGGAITELDELLSLADTPALESKRLSYSGQEDLLDKLQKSLQGRNARWRQIIDAARQSSALEAISYQYTHQMSQALTHDFISPAEHIAQDMRKALERLRQDLDAIVQSVEDAPQLNEETLKWGADKVKQLQSRRNQQALRRGAQRFLTSATPQRMQERLATLIAQIPPSLEVISPQTPLQANLPLEQLTLVSISPRACIEQYLRHEFTPEWLRAHRQIGESMGSLPARLSEGAYVIGYAFELASKEHLEQSEAKPYIIQSVQRTKQHLDELEQQLSEQLDNATQRLHGLIEQLTEHIQGEPGRANDRTSRRQLQQSLRRWLNQRYEELVEPKLGHIKTKLKALRSWLGALTQRQQVRALRIRAGLDRPDADHMLTITREQLPAPSALHEIPAPYTRLYALEALDDRRFFVGRSAELERLSQALKLWRRGQRAQALVTGEPGAGKSSLLNMFRFELSEEHIIRLDHRYSDKREGLLQALAAELGCSPQPQAISLKLKAHRHVIMVDGLEHWLLPSPNSLDTLKRWFELMSTSPETFWIVSLNTPAHRIIDAVYPLDRLFTHHVKLQSASWSLVKELILSRQRFSGMDFEPPSINLSTRMRQVFGRINAEEAYFRELSRTSGQDLRMAIYGHLRAAYSKDEDTIGGRSPHEQSVPYLNQLTEEELTLLAMLLTYGQTHQDDIIKAMVIPEQQGILITERLRFIGLVQEGIEPGVILIPPHLRGAICRELVSLRRIITEEAP